MRFMIIFLTTLLFGISVSDYRKKVGLNKLKYNQFLSQAAQLHSQYLYKNRIFSHYEDRNFPYFIGVRPSDRAVYSGYTSRFVFENISSGELNYSESIKDLFSAIYHRLGFLNFNINQIGYGKDGKFYVYDMGNSFIANSCDSGLNVNSGFIDVCVNKKQIIPKNIFYKQMKQNPKIVIWPYNGMREVPAVFYDEIPDPLPSYGVCGYPISISFNPYYVKNVKLVYFRIYNSVIKTKILTASNDVNHKLTKFDFVLFPLERLKYGKQYFIKAKFLVDGKIIKLSSSFKVEDSANIIEIDKREGEFYIYPNEKYTLYFKPLNKNDLISNVNYEYTSSLKIKTFAFKDANTLYIKVEGKKGDKIVIKTKNRKITLIVK